MRKLFLFVFSIFFLSCCAVPKNALIPDGFAVEKRENNYISAVSPEGCRYVYKQVANYPVKDADFWAQILKDHFSSKGYILKEDNSSESVRYFCWTIWEYNGVYTYMTAFSVNGKKITVVAAGGKESVMAGYKDKIQTIINKL